MSNIFTYSEARQNLASLLEKAAREGEVKVRRKDGQVFVIRPEPKTGSALDVEGIDLGVTSAEIVEFIRESRSLER
jgi:antitoxin Phd